MVSPGLPPHGSNPSGGKPGHAKTHGGPKRDETEGASDEGLHTCSRPSRKTLVVSILPEGRPVAITKSKREELTTSEICPA